MKVGIIGCGCSGLVTLKELLSEGHQCIVFERSSSLGGLYNQVYQEGTFVSSHLLTMFGDFPGNDQEIISKPRMLTFKEYLKYLDDYAEHFKLKENILYQQNVERLWKDKYENKWKIITNNSEDIYSFDRIAICSGSFGNPSIPTFKNQEDFQGKIRHMKDVQSYQELKNKRICIVGSGESASDLILAAAKISEKSFLSIRKDHGFIIPRYIHGNEDGPADLDTSRIHHSLPRSWGVIHTYSDMINSLIKSYLKTFLNQSGQTTNYDRIRREAIKMNLKQIRTSHIWNTFGTKNANLVEALINYPDKCQRKVGIQQLTSNSIIFDDQTEEQVDEIICCTGFENRFPYFDLNDKFLENISIQSKRSHSLYKHCFHPDLADDICWIGFVRPALGAVPPLIELQARWFSLICSKKLVLPDRSTMIKHIEKYRQYIRWQLTTARTDRLTNLTDFLIYSDDLARTIGCRPNLTKIFFEDPHLWMKLLFGPLINAQYRLVGPHSNREQARKIIIDAKWVKQPNILYLIMFCIYWFFWVFFRIESCKPAGWDNIYSD